METKEQGRQKQAEWAITVHCAVTPLPHDPQMPNVVMRETHREHTATACKGTSWQAGCPFHLGKVYILVSLV